MVLDHTNLTEFVPHVPAELIWGIPERSGERMKATRYAVVVVRTQLVVAPTLDVAGGQILSKLIASLRISTVAEINFPFYILSTQIAMAAQLSPLTDKGTS